MASHPPGVIPSITLQGDPHYMGPKYPPPPAPRPVLLPVMTTIPQWAPPVSPPSPPVVPGVATPLVNAAPSDRPDAPATSRTVKEWVQDCAAGAAMFGLLMGAFESQGSLWQIAIWTLGFATLGAWAGVLRWMMGRVFVLVAGALDAVLDACVKPLGLFAIGLAAAAFLIGYVLR